MKRIFFVIFATLFVITIQNVNAQRGKNGAKVITTTNSIVNEYTTLSVDATQGATSITVAANTLNTNNRFGSVLAAGDLIFIIQMQGAFITSGGSQWWSGYGYIDAINNAGLYEMAQVTSVQGSTTINLTCGLINNYTANGKVQIVRIPRYTTLTVNSGAELTCDTWDGSKGGVLVVETLGNVDNNGTINSSGKGFRGGAVSANSDNVYMPYYFSNNALDGASKGEGISGYGVVADGIYGRGAPANGGGGGNTHNAGGGGGSNCSNNFDWNGAGFPDTTTSATYKQAWDLETTTTVPTGVPFHKNASYGGGRGGYTFSAANLDALTVAPADASWGGDGRRPNGGLGGWPLNAYADGLTRLYLGGGGGGGSQNNSGGGSGAIGGGLIYLTVYGTISGTGIVTSNGDAGGNSFGTTGTLRGVDGCGGGGGGGAIVLNATGNISGISATANGGGGGTQIKYSTSLTNYEAEGPGGGGGGGYIAISNGTIIRSTIGGVNGTVTTTGLFTVTGVSEFPPNGATKGGPGVNNASVTNYNITASNVIACQSQPVTLTASITGTLPAGASYAWYSSEFGTTALSNSLTLTIPNPQTTTTYYFGVCPGTFRVAVTMTVSIFTPDAGINQSFCTGSSVTLNASGGTTYSWLPATGLSNTSIPNPVCTVGTTTLYTVHITNADGCQANDTVRVTVNSTANATITPQSALCVNSNTVTLSAAQSGGVWSGPGITNPATGAFSPALAGTGNIQIIYTISGTCSDSDTTHILVNAAPVINLGHDTTFCQGGSILLNAGNPGSTYSWTPGGSSSQTLNVSSSGQYIVQVTNAATCSKRDTINVTVNTSSNATITPHLPVCVNSATITLNAAQNGGLWSGPGITNPSSGTFNPASAGVGNIQIIYTISGSCGDADTTHIIVNALPVVNLGHDTTLCQGTSILLNAGNPGSTYFWTPGGSSSQTLNVTTAGQYIVQVTNAATCSKRDTVNVNFTPFANATITPHMPLCINASPVNLTAAQSGGVWSGPGITNPSTGAFNPAFAGTGNIQIIYTISGMCGDADTTHIIVNALPVVNLGHDTTLCQGNSILLNAGNPGSTYSWTPGGSTSQTLNVTASGQYIVQVTNAATCSKRDTININFTPMANPTITPHNPMCVNATPTILTAAQTGGIWSGPGITNPSTGAFNPSVAGSGNIQIIYTIAGTCGDDDTTQIIVNPLPVVNLGNDTTLCQGSTLLLNAGNPGSTYLWTNSTTNQTLIVSSGGTYWVEVTNANLCSKRDSIIVNVVPIANATITHINPVCSNISPFNLSAAQTGGIWSGNGISSSTNGIFDPSLAGSGNTIITYTIAGACGNMDTVQIAVLPSPIVSADTINPGCPDFNNGSIIMQTSGGTQPYTFSWSNGVSGNSAVDLTNGIYIVTVSDVNNCKEIRTVQFDIPLIDCVSPVIYVPNIFSPNGDGQNDNLYVRGQGIKTLNFVIFDRWGEKIFETTDQSIFWDGKFKGKDMPVGVYAYLLKATMNDGQKVDKKGNISLVR
jgi:gliding motility-associated-like protein